MADDNVIPLRPVRAKAFDFADLEGWLQMERALHGDLQPLIELLRSNEPIGKLVRDYLADEIEREPKTRFVKRRGADLEVRERDRMLLLMLERAKDHIAADRAGWRFDASEEEQLAIIAKSKPNEVSNRSALDWMQEHGWLDRLKTIAGGEIDEDTLRNARARRKRDRIPKP